MKKIVYGIPLMLSALVISCNNSPIDRIEKKINKEKSESVVRDIPKRIEKPGIVRELKSARVRTLGLTSLEDGVSGVQLRIWEDHEYLTGRLIIIKHIDDNWSAELCNYKYLSTGNFLPDSLAGQIQTLEKPNSGWNKFLNKLLDLDILTLLDFESIPDYDVSSDEKGVTVEIAKVNYYRFYEHMDPYQRQKTIPYAKRIVEILKLIKDEFNLP